MPEAEELRSHLAERYGFRAHTLYTLDQDVVLLRRDDGPNWVARVFPAERPLEAVEGDAEILRWLADEGYPAERCAAADPVSVLEDRPVLVTEAVAGVPRSQRRSAIKDAGGIARLGELLAVLATLAPPPGAPRRPGGAWHHAADGAPQRRDRGGALSGWRRRRQRPRPESSGASTRSTRSSTRSTTARACRRRSSIPTSCSRISSRPRTRDGVRRLGGLRRRPSRLGARIPAVGGGREGPASRRAGARRLPRAGSRSSLRSSTGSRGCCAHGR